MKKFTIKTLTAALALLLFASANAQEKKPAENNGVKAIRCGTMEYFNQRVKEDPTLPARIKAEAAKKLQDHQEQDQTGLGTGNSPTNINAITVVPVVFHVVGSAANQAFVTDESLQRQLDVLNRDFAGLNADSSRLPPAFKAIFGKSEIRFCMAKRTPTATATNGIQRRTTTQTFTTGTVANIKRTSAGGLDGWDGNKYLNIWLGNFSDGLLGIATFPNDGTPANEQGVVVHYSSIDQPCSNPLFANIYDGGRTLVHEVGHYFYLYHIWGDDGTACTGNDFRLGFGDLPASCTDDTPNQAGSSVNLCPSGTRTDACTTTAPGIMYQNYMDYTNDACYGMFTTNQVCRMQAALDLYRAGLKTSDGCVPVAPLTNNDVRVSEIINPNSRGFACNLGPTANFCDPFAPQVLLVNDGDAPLTSLTIETLVDNVSNTTFNWTGTLAPGDFRHVTLPFVNTTTGPHILTVRTRNPNGQPDARPNNDSARARFNQSGGAGVSLPLTEGFESTTFPPPGYTIFNPDAGSITWARSTLAAKTGVASMRINLYSYSQRKQIDIFQTPKINTLGADVVRVTFDVAYARYSTTDRDSLEIVYSTDCGATFRSTGYKKGQCELATFNNNPCTNTTSSFAPTNASQWRTETVDINVGCGTPIPSMIIGFRSINDFGNNIYIDNLDIRAVSGTTLDAKAVALTPPTTGVQCPGGSGVANLNRVFTFTNQGTTTLTSVDIRYQVDNNPSVLAQTWTGSLPKCENASVALTIPVPAGNHIVRVFTNLPNGSADLAPNNDTLNTGTFYVQETLPLNHLQGFEATTFPPTGGWRVINPDNATTWVRTTVAARTGAASMRIDGFNYAPQNNQLDILATPNISLIGVDSLKINFDVSYVHYSPAFADTLEVVYSTDCGVTWLPTSYKKGGVELNTNGGVAQTTPIWAPTSPTQWRNESLTLNTCDISASAIMYGIRFKNRYGQACYVDNLSIQKVDSRTFNASTVSIVDPPVTICDNQFTPRVTIGNFGTGPLTSVKINYRVDNNAVATFDWTGSLPRCSTAVVTLPAVTTTAGNHVFTVYTTQPNGSADQLTANDTVRKSFFNASAIVPLSGASTSLTEGFEGAAFAPENWGLQNPDNRITWTRATGNARTGTGAMVINNFNYAANNAVDNFLSTRIQNSTAFDSVFIAFDYAYAQGRQYPGATERPLDTLEVLISSDCGVTFKSVWKKWGEDLQTVNDPSYSNGLEFTPSAGAWKSEKVWLTPALGNVSNFQVFITSKSNNQNNIWMDNINVYSKTLPARLKNQGYLVYPNPFNNSFRIHHWTAPQNLQAVQIFNAAGQLVWDKRYSGNASTEIMVDLNKLASGTYTLKMTYSDKVVVERIIKNN